MAKNNFLKKSWVKFSAWKAIIAYRCSSFLGVFPGNVCAGVKEVSFCFTEYFMRKEDIVRLFCVLVHWIVFVSYKGFVNVDIMQ